MSSFTVLNAANPAERQKWLDVWACWPSQEINAHPAYTELFAPKSDCCICAVWLEEHGIILFPLIQRRINDETWADTARVVYDCISPYGYGGPFACGRPNVGEFWKSFREWAHENSVISLFTRLSLFEEQRIAFDGEVKPSSVNVIRDLNGSISEIWMDYDHKVRKNVNKARRNGLTVVVDNSRSRLADFLDIYYATMDRRRASSDYYFTPSFFEQLCDNFPEGISFFYCLHEGKAISAELILISSRYIYSYLGGTEANVYDLRPNDLLKHAIIEWGRANGKHAFVLGGGYYPDDGIFRYKQSFAPSGCVPFYTGQRIYDTVTYQCLVEQRAAWESRRGREWLPRSGYFPVYRA